MRAIAVLTLLAGLAGTVLAAEETPWSEPVNGIRARLVSDRAVYEEGQRVWLDLDVLNVGDKPVQFAWSYPLLNRLRLAESSGEAVGPQKPPPNEGISLETLPPGKQMNYALFYISGNQHAQYAPLKPGSYEATWPTQPGETVKGGLLPPPVSVKFRVEPRKTPPAPPGAVAGEVPWGKAEGGLRTRLRADRTVFFAGQPIPVVIEMENIGDRVLHYYPQPVGHYRGYGVTDAAGRAVPYIHSSGQTLVSLCSVKPKETLILNSVDLSEYYFLRRPGKYSTQWSGAKAQGRFSSWLNLPGVEAEPDDSDIPGTNRFEFEVVASGPLDPFDEALRVLLERQPPLWRVSSSPPVSWTGQPGSEWSRVHARRYRFEHERMHRDGRIDQIDIPSVRLCIASERAHEEPWLLRRNEPEEKTEYLGSGKYGRVYLAPLAANTLKHWPTARADLIKWLEIEAAQSPP